jgi:mitochondrial splicing suppressor protein 51
MISYCSPSHRAADADNHKTFCSAIQFIAKKRGGHCYHMSKKLDYQEFRNIRVYTLSLCETDLQRPLLSYEREILLFPRICAANICREWKPEALADCEHCGLVAYCANKNEHLPDSHKEWCKQFSLYHKLVQRQKANGKIEPEMPTKIVKVPTAPPASMDEIFKILYKNAANSLKDELLYSTMTQIATVPLTALLGLAHCSGDVPENFTIHLIGAELQFEGEAIEKWESFFLHFVPQITQLNIVFIGPEFNNENLPLDVISRIR